MDLSSYIDIFLAESRQYLQSLNESLLGLEAEPYNIELIHNMFRSAHSLKGMSSTMGYESIIKITHEMENTLHLLRKGDLSLNSRLTGILFNSLDTLEGLLEEVENAKTPKASVDAGQNAAIKLRMVPVKQVFDRFPRMVRELGRKNGKNVRLEIVGEDIELDRSIINRIGDPLVHLLRNAVDHGIEPAEERKKAGKDSLGLIRLEARREGSYIAIEVRDDGAGLDAEKLISIALKKKVITKEGADGLRLDGAHKLIFKKGFSTAEQVTDISGRGVGMDAVKNTVERLNGRIEIHSTAGNGTSITLRLPLSPAIIKVPLSKAHGDSRKDSAALI